MNHRIAVSIAILACAGCDPRKPAVIDPAHPDHSYKWPATQPTAEKGMISYRVHIRLSEYDPDRLDGIAQAVYGVVPFRNETWAHDNSTGGVKAEGVYRVGPGLKAHVVVRQLSEAAWMANRGWCKVQVRLVRLQPDWYCLGGEEYALF